MNLAAFEELDYGMTPLGELILRRREVISLDRAVVYEVKLDGQFLMSSIVNYAEIALAELSLPMLASDQCNVLVGGLGLGHTANAALESDKVASITVIEFLQKVISWHECELVPLGRTLMEDPRCQLMHGDFFEVVGSPTNQDIETPPHWPRPLAGEVTKRFHAVLLDIDHSPQCLLQAGHADFYTSGGLQRLTEHIQPGGVFAIWSADPLEDSLAASLNNAFESVRVHECRFYNPLLDEQDINYIIVAQRSAES
ncbi:MAG: polyamine aminopropyltransferase [Planctomycetota bacterium]|jgi:spermidine synthase